MNGLSMSETDPLNYKWLDFAIQSGLTLHQLKKKTAVKDILLKKALISKQEVF